VINRRQALAGGAAAGALLAAPRALAADDLGARAYLPRALAGEHAVWAGYGFALDSGTLTAADSKVIRRLRKHSDENATAVEAVLRRLGATPAARPRSIPFSAATRQEWLAFALQAQQIAVVNWYRVLQQLRQPELIELGAAAMSADAQALAALRRRLGREPLAFPFENGRPE
jgi:hypothetical protein